MKELSIEEKAKRYDEAIKRVEDIVGGKCPKPFVFTEGLFDYIFPKLKENEDEKIRKALICGMYALKEQYKTCFASIPIDNVIAWLEKQGDKDELIKELGEYKAKYTQEVLEKHLRVMNKDDERLRKTTISFLKDFADKGYENAVECIDWLEKQSEQKSQGKTALEAIKEEKVDNANKVEPRQEKLTEFEKAVKQVMEEAIECGDTRNLKADAEMLLSLAHNSSWSEEDEAHIMAIDLAVNKCLGKWHCCGEKCPISEHNPWLKCLKDRVQSQSTWKPSDEQIKAVKEAACYSSVFGEKTIDNLISLSKDLKKLKG